MLENWRTDFDWTDPEDAPVSWSELDAELEKQKAPWNRPEPKKTLKVRFVNRGYGSDEGLKEVSVVRQDLCELTLMPLLIIENPWWSGDTLKCQWYDNEWVCDLD